ncbi:MAG: outer membrane beta-barrel protein [Bacteroidia bacterium]|jgi:hypothetical protein|nr:outer membrane beta-barrel protein [Bacteroidia bacterium]
MSLFKKHKSFEQQLQQQLADAEFKPTDSLWNQIDSRLEENAFEQAVRGKVDSFETIPNPSTWNRIEDALTAAEIKQRKRIGFFIGGASALLLALLTFALLNNPQPKLQNQLASMKKPEVIQPQTPSNNGKLASPEIKPLPKTNSKRSTDESNPVTQKQMPYSKEAIVLSNSRNLTPAQGPSVLTAPSTTTPGQQALVANDQTPLNNNQNNRELAPQKQTLPPINIDSATRSAAVNPTQPSLQATAILTTANTDSLSAQQANNNQYLEKNTIAKIDSSINPSVAKVRELTGTDTSLVVPVSTNETKQTNENELTRFSISIYAGAHYSFTNYAKPQSGPLNFDENIAFRKQLERPAIDWSGGFLIDYHLTERWMVSSGVLFVQFNQKFQFDTTQALVPANPAEIGAPVLNPSDSFIFGNRYSDRIRYSWTEIPIWFNYTAAKGKRWNADIQFGMSYGFIGTIDAGIVSYDNKGILVAQDKDAFPQIRNTLFATVIPQVSYTFGQEVSIGIAPSFKYGLQSIIGNPSWVQQHPYFVGLNMCLRKRF